MNVHVKAFLNSKYLTENNLTLNDYRSIHLTMESEKLIK